MKGFDMGIKTVNHDLVVRQMVESDFDNVLALNQELVHFLSDLDMNKLIHLCDESDLQLVVEEKGKFVGFLLAFREGADYDSINYTWFESHYPQFLYVDRVVISPDAQSGGMGKVLYDEIFRYAREIGVPVVTAEYNVIPANEISEKFHARYGFEELARQQTTDGKKIVALVASKVMD
jgi:uncharacterized protein